MSARKLHVQQQDVSSFHFYHRTLNQTCSAAKSPNASLQCAWNLLLWNCWELVFTGALGLVFTDVFFQALIQETDFCPKKGAGRDAVPEAGQKAQLLSCWAKGWLLAAWIPRNGWNGVMHAVCMEYSCLRNPH